MKINESKLKRIINNSIKSIIKENTSNVIPNKLKLFDLLDEGLVDTKWMVRNLIRWISEDDAKRFIEYYDLGDSEYEDDDIEL